jgi:hypothetical protein
MAGCIAYSSVVTSQTVARRMSRGYMPKHEYANLVRLAVSQPLHQYCAMFVPYAYPAHYIVMYGMSISGPHIVTNITMLWNSIMVWYNYKRPKTNKICHNVSSISPTVLGFFSESVHSFTHWYGCTCQTGIFTTMPDFTGGGKFQLTYKLLCSYVITSCADIQDDNTSYQFVSHVPYQTAIELARNHQTLIVCRMPLGAVTNYLTLGQAKSIAKMHGLFIAHRAPLAIIVNALVEHQCSSVCYDNVYLFKQTVPRSEQKNSWYNGLGKAKRKERQTKNIVARRQVPKDSHFKIKTKISAANKKTYQSKKQSKFPPIPPTAKLVHKIVTEFCKDTHPSQFEESGCAACGQLTPLKDLIKLNEIKCSLDPLVRNGVTSFECTSESNEVLKSIAPILDADCHGMCYSCHKHLDKGVSPPMALANGLWLGKVPAELSRLSFVEKLLIARIRHNRCIIKIAAGRYKMKANAISFQNPIPKVYDILPPPLEELDQVLACIFTGPCQPTKKDVERTPLLVRHTQVGKALQWLKLNHIDYHNCNRLESCY